VLCLAAPLSLIVSATPSSADIIDPATVAIGNSPTLPGGAYLKGQDIANALTANSVVIQARNSLTIVDPVDLSTSTVGTPRFSLTLVSPVINIENNMNLGSSGHLFLTSNILNLNGEITSGGTTINPSRVTGTATQVNVLSNAASIHQAVDLSSTTSPVTVQVNPGSYAENLIIDKNNVTLTGNDGTSATGADPTAPTLAGTQAGGNVVTVAANGVTLDGLNLDGTIAGDSTTSSVGGIYASGVDGLTVRHDTFDGFSGLSVATPGSINVVSDANVTLIDPASVSIGNAPQQSNGTYINAQKIADNLVFTSINIQANNSIDIVDSIDLSHSTFGTPHFNLSLNSLTLNIINNMNLSYSGNLFLSTNILNLNGEITSGGTTINPSRVTGTATQVNVLSNAATIQQGIDLSSTTSPVVVQVSSGQYAEHLTIGKSSLTLSGNDGTAAAGADPSAPTIAGTQASGNVITDTANGVTIHGLQLDGQVNGGSSTSSVDGVYASGVNGLTLSHNTLNGFSGPGIETPGSTNTAVNANVIGPTSITSASNYTFSEGSSPAFTVTASGTPAPTFSDPGPLDGLTIDPVTGALSGTPTTSGTFDSIITADNGYGSPATQNFTLTVDPSLCTVGNYSATGTSPCSPAPPGTYVDTTGATAPTDCPVGTYNPNSGSASSGTCISAPAGTYVDTPGSAAATPCGVGTYNPNTGSTSSAACVPAPAGNYVGTTGASSASPCAVGTYSPTSGATMCTPAPPNTYVATTGATAATPCPAGTFNPNSGSTSVAACLVLPFRITTTAFPSATPGSPYGPVDLQAAGEETSTSPFATTLKWKKIALPRGLKLSSTGVLSGTPSAKLAAGPSSVTVQVTETVTTLNGKTKVKTKTMVQATIPLTIT
jgi:hypothetical protein